MPPCFKMPKPTVRVLLPPRPSSDSHTDSPTSPRTVRIYRRPSSGLSYCADYAYSTDPSPPLTITIRRRSSDREDRRWEDSRPSSPRPSIPYTASSSAAAPPPLSSPGSIRHEYEHERPRPSSSAAIFTRGPLPTPAAPPAPSSATSSASSHSRRSSLASSDYLYGQDYAYGAEPLRLRAARPTGAVTIRGSGPEGSAAARRRVRFVTHYQ